MSITWLLNFFLPQFSSFHWLSYSCWLLTDNAFTDLSNSQGTEKAIFLGPVVTVTDFHLPLSPLWVLTEPDKTGLRDASSTAWLERSQLTGRLTSVFLETPFWQLSRKKVNVHLKLQEHQQTAPEKKKLGYSSPINNSSARHYNAIVEFNSGKYSHPTQLKRWSETQGEESYVYIVTPRQTFFFFLYFANMALFKKKKQTEGFW